MGRYFNNKIKPPKRDPLEGMEVGKLTVGRYRGQQVYVVRCICGNEFDMTATGIKRNDRLIEAQCPDCYKVALRALRKAQKSL